MLTKFRRYSLFSSCFAPSSQFQSSIATGVCIACKQKPKLSWVLHHTEAYFFCLMSCLITCSPCLVSDFDSRLDSDQWLCVTWDFDPRCDPAQLGPARPSPARPWTRATSAPSSPMCPLLSLSLIQFFSARQLPLFHLSFFPLVP
jgi:hypothetical protein